MPGHSFVTGANGRIGRVLVERLVSSGERVVGLARSEIDGIITKIETRCREIRRHGREGRALLAAVERGVAVL